MRLPVLTAPPFFPTPTRCWIFFFRRVSRPRAWVSSSISSRSTDHLSAPPAASASSPRTVRSCTVCSTAMLLSPDLSGHPSRASDACRPPCTDGRCVPMLFLADARGRATRAPYRQPLRRRKSPRRCGLPAASGCRPDVAGGRLSCPASILGASQVPAGCAAWRHAWWAAQRPPSGSAAASRRSSRRRREGATMRACGREVARGAVVCAAAAAAVASRAPARCAWVARTPPAARRSGRPACACCRSACCATVCCRHAVRPCGQSMPST